MIKYLSSKTRADLSAVQDDTPLFSTGTIDSFTLVDFFEWLNRKAGARIEPSDVSIDNFDSIGRVLQLVESRKR